MRADDGTASEFTDGSHIVKVDKNGKAIANGEADLRDLTGDRPVSTSNKNQDDDFNAGNYPSLSQA